MSHPDKPYRSEEISPGEIIFYVIYPQFWEIINFFWMILGNFEKIEIGFFLKITNERGITSKERGKI